MVWSATKDCLVAQREPMIAVEENQSDKKQQALLLLSFCVELLFDLILSLKAWLLCFHQLQLCFGEQTTFTFTNQDFQNDSKMNQETNQDEYVEVGVNVFQSYFYSVAYLYQSHFETWCQRPFSKASIKKQD